MGSNRATMGPKMITIWELTSQLHRTSVTQGFLAGILLRNLDAFTRYFLWTRQLHSVIVWELIFQLHAHLLHIKEVFFVPNCLCNHLGNPNGGSAKGVLARKGPIGPKRALSGRFLLFPRQELVPIGPEKAPTSPEMAPICPEKAPIFQEGFPPDFLWKFGA